MRATGEANGMTAPKGDADIYGLSGVYPGGPLTVQAYFQTGEFDNGARGAANTNKRDLDAQYRFGAFHVALKTTAWPTTAWPTLRCQPVET